MKRKLLSYSFILLTAGILLRLIVYFLLPAKEAGQYSIEERLYLTALTEHLQDYLATTTNIPPLTHILNVLVLSVTGIETALRIRGFLLLDLVLDIAAVMFVFDAACKAGGRLRLPFVAALLFSAALVPFELWREGWHYDHHTVFFTSFFAWSLVRMTRRQYISDLFLVSLSGMLLVAQSSVSLVVVPVTVITITGLLFIPRRRFRSFIRSASVSLTLPVLALLLISNRDKTGSSEALTSNKGGPAMMMVVQRAYNYDVAAVRGAAVAAGAPAWYLWAYDHATPAIDPGTGKPYDWVHLSQAFGICFYATSAGAGQPPFRFDFSPLLQYLRENDHRQMSGSVQQDSIDAAVRPYRFAGYSPELSPRWIGIFGNVSKIIFFKTLIRNPAGMLKAFAVQQGIFAIYGPLFPYNVMSKEPSWLSRSGLRTLQDKIPLHAFFVFITLVFAVVGWLMYMLVLLRIPVTIWKMIRQKGFSASIGVFQLLSVPVVCIVIMFSCLVGGENDRYFMQIAPYLFILMCCIRSTTANR